MTKRTSAKKVAPVVPSLDPRLFNRPASESLIAQVLHVYRDHTHQQTSKVKTRGEVNRTTKKVYKQKGTGNARHGARSAPIYVGGGVAHGPTGIRPFPLKINRKMAASALAGLLTLKAKEDAAELVALPALEKPSTQKVKSIFPIAGTLVVHAREVKDLYSSARNLTGVTLVEAAKLNPYLIAASHKLILTPAAQEILLTRLLPLLKSKI